MATTGSANPSFKGLELSIENLTHHFEPSEIDAIAHEFDVGILPVNALLVEAEWFAREKAKLKLKEQVAAPRASEGLTTEEEQTARATMKRAKKNANNNEYAKKRHKTDKSAGQCVRCHTETPEAGGVMCQWCKKKEKVVRDVKKDQGKCGSCSKPKPRLDGTPIARRVASREPRLRLTREHRTCV